MPTRGRPAKPVEIRSAEKDHLEKLILDSGASRISKRARVVLLTSTGTSNSAIAKQLNWSHASVCKWKQRYRGPV